MKIKAYAKVNLTLNVIGTDPIDNYHLLEMVNVPLDLYDEVSVDIIEGNESIVECTYPGVPLDNSNIVLKVIKLMKKEYSISQNFKVVINKKIPLGAGLAGGSTDGAATILAINELCNLYKTKEELSLLGMKAGADIAFCIYSQPAIVKGKGEIIIPFSIKEPYYLLLIKPPFGISTKEAYQKCDQLLNKGLLKHSNCELLARGLQEGDMDIIKNNLVNNLEETAITINRGIIEIEDYLHSLGLENVMMTGSGSTVFAISKNKKELEDVSKKIDNNYYFVHLTSIKND